MKRSSIHKLILWLFIVASICACTPSLDSADTQGTLIVAIASAKAKDFSPTGYTLDHWSFTVLDFGGATAYASSSLSPTTTSIDPISLAVGIYTITANGYNDDSVLIASGSTSVTIVAGASATASIAMRGISGTGTLSLTASWSYSLSSPAVTGSLTPTSGTATTLSFTVSEATAAHPSTAIAAGSYTLSLIISVSGKAVYRSVPQTVLIAAGLTTTGAITQWVPVSTSTVEKIINHSNFNNTLSDTEINAAAALKVYFEHASVGQCIADDGTILATSGLSALKASDGRYTCGRTTWDHSASSESEMTTTEAAWFSTNHGLGDNFRGNYGAVTKADYFKSSIDTINSSLGGGVAMFKFCYIDFPGGSACISLDASGLYTKVKGIMDGLESSYPNITFVWWTMPLQIAGDQQETRQAYNDSVRKYCADNGKWLFDIADIESHDDSGNPYTASEYEVMYTGYTSDDGHPNADCALKLARAYWKLIAEIAKE
jgi:hypothetical protein